MAIKPTALIHADALAYAVEWIATWNRRDVEAVLELFSDDVVFTSPRATSIVGSARIEGKAMLAKRWTQAIAAIQTIHFTLDYVVAEGNRVAIVYTSDINGKRIRAVELLVFGSDGSSIQAKPCTASLFNPNLSSLAGRRRRGARDLRSTTRTWQASAGSGV